MLAERGKEEETFLTVAARSLPTLIVGRPGSGKATALEHMILRDIERGDGVAVLDAHGDLAEYTLGTMPADRVNDVMYFEPGNPDFCPIWNPLKNIRNISLTAEAIVDVMNNDTALGFKREQLLRQCILGILHLDNPTLADIPRCLSTDDDARRQFQKRILKAVKNEKLREFWNHHIKKYNQHDFASVSIRFTKLLMYDTIGLMLSQPEQRFDFEKIPSENKVFVADLSKVCLEVRAMLGGLITRFFYCAVRGRENMPPEQRKSFHLYVDGADFPGKGIQDLLFEGRRLRVSLTLAHQTLDEMKAPLASDALAIAGTTIVFRVHQTDAVRLGKVFGTDPQDLTSLRRREAIARIEDDVRRVTVPPPHMVPDRSRRDRIIQISHQRYCRPAEEVRADLRSRKPVTSSW